MAAEFGNVEAATLLLDRGAHVDARATVDGAGVGGQTAIFHAVTPFDDQGLPMARLLSERGADLSVRVKFPGHYDRPDEVVEGSPLGYARGFRANLILERKNDSVLARARDHRVSRLTPL